MSGNSSFEKDGSMQPEVAPQLCVGAYARLVASTGVVGRHAANPKLAEGTLVRIDELHWDGNLIAAVVVVDPKDAAFRCVACVPVGRLRLEPQER